MRNIIFRGKRLDTGEWIYGDLRQYSPVCFGIHDGNIGRTIKVDPETIGQYTGVTDKDGKHIFEGDVVSGLFYFGMKKNAQVYFKDGAFGLAWFRGDVAQWSAFTSICNVTYQVLGNIYDAPEVLFKEE